MTESVNKVALAMKNHFQGDIEKIQHFTRVYTLGKTIGELEKLPELTQEYLELACLVHEIEAEDKIPAIKEILLQNGVDDDTAIRICHIVENKDNYEHITGLDHQILIEADFIVHIKEENYSRDKIIKIGEKYFITNYGKAFLKKAFNI